MRRPAFSACSLGHRGISGGPVVKTQRSQCGGHGFDPGQRTMVSSKKKVLGYPERYQSRSWRKAFIRGTAPLHKPGPFPQERTWKLSGTGLNTQRSEDKIPSQHLSIPISAWESKSPLNSDENSEEKNVMDIQGEKNTS